MPVKPTLYTHQRWKDPFYLLFALINSSRVLTKCACRALYARASLACNEAMTTEGKRREQERRRGQYSRTSARSLCACWNFSASFRAASLSSTSPSVSGLRKLRRAANNRYSSALSLPHLSSARAFEFCEANERESESESPFPSPARVFVKLTNLWASVDASCSDSDLAGWKSENAWLRGKGRV